MPQKPTRNTGSTDRGRESLPLNALDALAVLGAWLLAVAVARMPILTPDVWWHLATGRLIVTSGFPQTDPFSWALAGAPWFLHEWLADWLLYQVHQSADLLGIVAFRTVLIVAAFLAAYRLARLHAGVLLSLLLLTPAAWASQRNWLDRPQLWTFLFLPLLLWLLEATRQRGISRRTWILTPLLFLAWANLHGGFMLGLAVAALWIVAVLVQSMRSDSPWCDTARRQRRGWILLLALAAAATLVTPHGVEGLLYPLRYVGSGLSESLNEERVGLLNSNYARVHLVLAVLLCVTFVWRAGRACWAYGAVGLFLVALSLPQLGGFAVPFAAERHAPLFLLVGVPILAWQLQRWMPAGPLAAWQGHLRGRPAWAAAVLVIAVGAVLAGRQLPHDAAAVGPDANSTALLLPGRYPVAATQWLQQNQLPQRLLNPYRWGGWLLFHLWPSYTVSIDSRGDLYGIERIRESEFLHQMPPGAEVRVPQILDRDAIDLVIWHLLSLDFGPLQVHPFADWLLQSPDWRLVFWDRPDPRHPDHPAGTTAVFLREHPRNQAILAAHPAVRLPRLPGQRRRYGFPPQR